MLEKLVSIAEKEYHSITPCSGKTWDESVTEDCGVTILWFNTPDGSTHIVKL